MTWVVTRNDMIIRCWLSSLFSQRRDA